MNSVINEQVVNWIVENVNNNYKDDISIVAIYGSYVNGTANRYSDVDCYFIPKTDRGEQFATDFIINGIGYDIFPMSWDRVERIANLSEMLLPCVGDVEIVFSNSDADAQRFKALQHTLKVNLTTEACTTNAATERFNEACEQYKLMLQAVKTCNKRTFAAKILMRLADAIAIYNHTYFHKGLKMQYQDLQDMGIPSEILTMYLQIIKANDDTDIVNSCLNMINLVADYINATAVPIDGVAELPYNSINSTINYDELACMYEEIISTFNKIYYCAESNNYILAYISAASLQEELDNVTTDNNLPSFALIGSFVWDDLAVLATTTKLVQNALEKLIIDGGATICSYESFDMFVASHVG